MGRQTSRIWYQQKDHKEMVTYNGGKPQYHDSAWIWTGNSFQLVWKKLYSAIADPIIGIEFYKGFIPYKVGNYYVGNAGTNQIYGEIQKVDKDTHNYSQLLEADVDNKVSLGGVAKDGRIIAVKSEQNRLYVIDVDSATILLATDINVVGDSYNYKENTDYFASIHHKYMFSNNGQYRYEAPTTGREGKVYTDLTDAYISLHYAGGVGSLCPHVTTILMGSSFQTQYGIRTATVSPYRATFVEILSMGHPTTIGNIQEEEWWSEIILEKEFPFDTNGGMNYYMDNGHLIIAEHVWNPTLYYIVEIPSLEYFTVDVSEITDANNYSPISVSPSGNTIIYQCSHAEQDHTYKYYKKDKNDEHWQELLCSNASYDFDRTQESNSFDLVDDSVFFMKRGKTVGARVYDVYQAYKLRQKEI